ncbi:MAG: patatin family protein [Bacteroidales bacterium]|nr:patatin family protein [Bacteroidales bacterium]
MTLDSHIGLVLEGGGMRGVFTSGALDYLLDRDINFAYCVGVSAGACNGLSYMSRQRGRAKKTNIDLLERFQYIGVKYLWTQHSILDQDTIYNKIPNELLPFDYATCFANPMKFEMVTTSCRTGKACYLTESADPDRLVRVAKASSSLPFVCPIVDIDGEPMLDGGIVDSIPVERAMATGHSFNVVVMTRPRGFRSDDRDIKMPRFIYRNYPRLRLVLSHRHAYYNRQLKLVERLEDEGKIMAIRPVHNLEVGRLESNVKKLTALYEEGYECARQAFEQWEQRGGFPPAGQ